jgi:uncharacterized membrane protein YidH (DUF202 family)
MSEEKLPRISKLNLSMSIERTYASFMRNCITLFGLGLTIINLTKRRKGEKITLSFIIMLLGIILGAAGTKEYYDRIKLIKENKYKDIPLLSYTLSITTVLIVIFFIIFCYKIINVNEETNFIGDLKKKFK